MLCCDELCSPHSLETAHYGAHSVVPQAPALGLVLFSRWCLAEDGGWKKFVEPTDLSSFHSRSFGKFSDRLRLFSRPQISIQARCVAVNTFVHSVMLYAISYLGITTRDLNYLRQSAVRMVFKRHWLEAEILPYVLRYVGAATLIDPALAATIAALGLFLRRGGNPQDLWADGSHGRQTIATRILLSMWADYLPLEQLRAAIYQGRGDPRRTVCQVKTAISKCMQSVARTVLLNKICTEGWIGGISHQWIDGLSKVTKKMCNGIARYAVLRWALNQDDDHWLANRGRRHQFPCARCGSRADCFPWGFYAAPMCDPCVVSLNLTAFTLASYSLDLFTCQVSAAWQSQSSSKSSAVGVGSGASSGNAISTCNDATLCDQGGVSLSNASATLNNQSLNNQSLGDKGMGSPPSVEMEVETTGFAMAACKNHGQPISVEWDSKSRFFIDGFGLCSPICWQPWDRGVNRSPEASALLTSIYSLLLQEVVSSVGDPRRVCYELVLGRLKSSPFPLEAVDHCRAVLRLVACWVSQILHWRVSRSICISYHVF